MRKPLLEGITFSAILWPVKARRPDPVSSFSASRHAYRARNRVGSAQRRDEIRAVPRIGDPLETLRPKMTSAE
jgi:hypothetical protein